MERQVRWLCLTWRWPCGRTKQRNSGHVGRPKPFLRELNSILFVFHEVNMAAVHLSETIYIVGFLHHLINFLCSCRVQFRVSEHQEQNKMGQNNLATVFGPNILRPSSSSSADPADLAQGTLDVMTQVSIFLWFLKCASVQLPSDPNLLHRLAPRKPPEIVIAPAPTEEQPDRLIWHDISRSTTAAMNSLVFERKPHSAPEGARVLTRLFIRMPRCCVTRPSIWWFGYDIIVGSCINIYHSHLLLQNRDHNKRPFSNSHG